ALFTWANTSRYVYTPAVGFAMRVGLGIAALDRSLHVRVPPAVRISIVSFAALAVVVRFAVFTTLAVYGFVARTEAYRTFLGASRASPPVLARRSRVRVALADSELREPYVVAMLQWEYDDPDLRVEFDSPLSRP